MKQIDNDVEIWMRQAEWQLAAFGWLIIMSTRPGIYKMIFVVLIGLFEV